MPVPADRRLPLRRVAACGVRGREGPSAEPMPDLALLIAMALSGDHPLTGSGPAEVLDPVPQADLVRASVAGIPSLLDDLDSDTRDVVLTSPASGPRSPLARSSRRTPLPTGPRPAPARASPRARTPQAALSRLSGAPRRSGTPGTARPSRRVPAPSTARTESCSAPPGRARAGGWADRRRTALRRIPRAPAGRPRTTTEGRPDRRRAGQALRCGRCRSRIGIVLTLHRPYGFGRVHPAEFRSSWLPVVKQAGIW